MPNYVKNKLVISQKDAFDRIVAECIRPDENGQPNMDFESVVPMPRELLEVPCGSPTTDGIILVYSTASKERKASIIEAIKDNMWLQDAIKPCLAKDYKGLRKMDDEQIANARAYGEKALSNLEKYGAFCWYDWCVKNWGTKWNACETEVDEGEKSITFWTAWSLAKPFIVALSKKYHCRIKTFFADEDLGRNCGLLLADDGKVVHYENFEADSKQSYVLGCSLWNCDIAEYTDETWETLDGNPMYVQA